MGSLALRFGVAAIACLVGIVASTVCREHCLVKQTKRIDNVQLNVESVEFSDGTTWSLPLAM